MNSNLQIITLSAQGDSKCSFDLLSPWPLIMGIIMISIILVGKMNLQKEIKQTEKLPNVLQESNEFNDTKIFFYTDFPKCFTIRKQEFNDCIYEEGYTVRTYLATCPENPNFEKARKHDVYLFDENPICTELDAFTIRSNPYSGGSSIALSLGLSVKYLTPDFINGKVKLNGIEDASWKIYKIIGTESYVIKVVSKDLYISFSPTPVGFQTPVVLLTPFDKNPTQFKIKKVNLSWKYEWMLIAGVFILAIIVISILGFYLTSLAHFT